ncbi:hypothetical protein Tdes44962_MAKER04257 [Teratosphaeria destructans]|uniref:Extracellular membrane protein CFEM domain-containing protein n=1 Tax=Teratosphaeria destructans TaxID=418781 RepID=A0A9W7SN28_9PEZI|nr:hypothetical protein Tdes44962_MAKER04257 [Teratosphaeria destructans]
MRLSYVLGLGALVLLEVVAHPSPDPAKKPKTPRPKTCNGYQNCKCHDDVTRVANWNVTEKACITYGKLWDCAPAYSDDPDDHHSVGQEAEESRCLADLCPPPSAPSGDIMMLGLSVLWTTSTIASGRTNAGSTGIISSGVGIREDAR